LTFSERNRIHPLSACRRPDARSFTLCRADTPASSIKLTFRGLKPGIPGGKPAIRGDMSRRQIHIGVSLHPQDGWPQEASQREALVMRSSRIRQIKLQRKDHNDLEEKISYSCIFAVFGAFVVQLFR